MSNLDLKVYDNYISFQKYLVVTVCGYRKSATISLVNLLYLLYLIGDLLRAPPYRSDQELENCGLLRLLKSQIINKSF